MKNLIGFFARFLREHRVRVTLERGTTAVELALVTPFLLLLVFGMLDFGRAVVLYNVSAEAAREGARVGMVLVAPNPTPSAAPTMTASQTTAIADAAHDKAGALAPQVTVTSSAGIDATGPYVRVSASANYQPVAGQFLKVGTIPTGATSTLYLP